MKFLNTGSGSARSALIYLFRLLDYKGKPRPAIELMRGNPEQVTAVAESLEFKHTYRSAVIAWHPDDRPTRQQVEEVLTSFEELAFAGLEPNQYTYYAVWHGEENGGGHIHIVTPRVELQSGKSLNIAPPGWKKTYDPLRDLFNAKYGWKSPDIVAHPENARVTSLSEIHKLPETVSEARKMIAESITAAAERGLIEDRNDVISKLKTMGEITRIGKNYISLKPPGFDKAIRLKGVFCGEGFETHRVREAIKRAGRERTEADRRAHEQEVKRLEGVIREVAADRREYHQNRYKQTRKIDHERDRGTPGIGGEMARDQAGKLQNRGRISDGVDRDGDRDRHDRPIQLRPSPDAKRADQNRDQKRGYRHERIGRKIRPNQSNRKAHQNRNQGINDDRDREEIIRRIAALTERTNRICRQLDDLITRADQATKSHNRATVDDTSGVEKAAQERSANREIESSIGAIFQRVKEELSGFKRGITERAERLIDAAFAPVVNRRQEERLRDRNEREQNEQKTNIWRPGM